LFSNELFNLVSILVYINLLAKLEVMMGYNISVSSWGCISMPYHTCILTNSLYSLTVLHCILDLCYIYWSYNGLWHYSFQWPLTGILHIPQIGEHLAVGLGSPAAVGIKVGVSTLQTRAQGSTGGVEHLDEPGVAGVQAVLVIRCV